MSSDDTQAAVDAANDNGLSDADIAKGLQDITNRLMASVHGVNSILKEANAAGLVLELNMSDSRTMGGGQAPTQQVQAAIWLGMGRT